MQHIAKYLAASTALAVLLPATAAFAQATTPPAAAAAGASVLAVNLMTAPSAPAGTQGALLALIQLDGRAAATDIQVGTIPLALSFSGVSPNAFTNCSMRNVNNIGTPLNTGVYAVTSLSPSSVLFSLDTPLIIPAGSVVDLAMACNINPVAAGGAVHIALQPSAIQATDAAGAAVQVIGGQGANGAAGPVSGAVVICPVGNSAGATPGAGAPGTGAVGAATVCSTSGTPTSTPPTSSNGGYSNPGIPNTGAGGTAESTLMVLLATAAVALGGAYVLSRRTRAQ